MLEPTYTLMYLIIMISFMPRCRHCEMKPMKLIVAQNANPSRNGSCNPAYPDNHYS